MAPWGLMAHAFILTVGGLEAAKAQSWWPFRSGPWGVGAGPSGGPGPAPTAGPRLVVGPSRKGEGHQGNGRTAPAPGKGRAPAPPAPPSPGKGRQAGAGTAASATTTTTTTTTRNVRARFLRTVTVGIFPERASAQGSLLVVSPRF